MKGLPALPVDPIASQGLLGSGTDPSSTPPPTDITGPISTQPPSDSAVPVPAPSDATSAAPPIDANGAANQISTQNLDSAGSLEQASGTQDAPVSSSEP